MWMHANHLIKRDQQVWLWINKWTHTGRICGWFGCRQSGFLVLSIWRREMLWGRNGGRNGWPNVTQMTSLSDLSDWESLTERNLKDKDVIWVTFGHTFRSHSISHLIITWVCLTTKLVGPNLMNNIENLHEFYTPSIIISIKVGKGFWLEWSFSPPYKMGPV